MPLTRPKNVLTTNLSGTIPTTSLSGAVSVGNMPTGSVIQVVSSSQSGSLVINTAGFQTLSGYSVNITPSSTSSKIFISYSLGRATTNQHNLDHAAALRVMRGNVDSDLNSPSNGSRIRTCGMIMGLAYNDDHNPGPWSFSGIDSPATTSQITYSLQASIQSTSHPLHINATINNSDTGNVYHGSSKGFFIAMEIKG
tara:strand:+ start:657 stop:1247 length:591 start_codon:yes stop_codon:yes gene_type:complete